VELELLDLAARNGVSEPYILNAKAAIERAKNNHDLARVHLLAAMRADPNHAATYYNLASLYQDHFNLLADAREIFEMYKRHAKAPEDQARKAGQRAQDIEKSLARTRNEVNQTRDPERARRRMEEAARFEAARNWPSALAAYVEAKNADLLSVRAHRALAEYYEKRNDTVNAFRAYVEAANLPDAPAEVLAKAASYALAQKRFDIADPFCSRAMARAPNNIDLYYQMARVRDGQKRPRDAHAYATHYLNLAKPGPATAQIKTWADSLLK